MGLSVLLLSRTCCLCRGTRRRGPATITSRTLLTWACSLRSLSSFRQSQAPTAQAQSCHGIDAHVQRDHPPLTDPACPAAESPEATLTPHLPGHGVIYLTLTHRPGFLGLGSLYLLYFICVLGRGPPGPLNSIVNNLSMDSWHPPSVCLASAMAGNTSGSAWCRSWVSFCFLTAAAWGLQVRRRGGNLRILCAGARITET